MGIENLTALEIKEKVARKEISAREVAAEVIKNVKALEPKIEAFMLVDEEGALAAAEAVDKKIAAGRPLGRLAGVPLAVKDNMATRGKPTTCSSKILGNFRPPYDAHIVERINAEDGVIVGKTNLDEFAMGSSTENSAFKTTKNPWDTSRIPGGSSGGSAACVASRALPLSLGSDTGGSIRQPASHCGVIGFKPTYGRVSRYGLVAFASSLDQIGPFARTAGDAALIMEVIAGHDRRDSTSSRRSVPGYLAALDSASVSGRRFGIPKEYFGEGLDEEVKKSVLGAAEVFKSAGAEI
ncbi:unnamed protein product, partial [marine sediment metagenome]